MAKMIYFIHVEQATSSFKIHQNKNSSPKFFDCCIASHRLIVLILLSLWKTTQPGRYKQNICDRIKVKKDKTAT